MRTASASTSDEKPKRSWCMTGSQGKPAWSSALPQGSCMPEDVGSPCQFTSYKFWKCHGCGPARFLIEDSPEGDPCGKVTLEAAESFPVTAEAARISRGSRVPRCWHPMPAPPNRVLSKVAVVETNTRASLTRSQGALGVCGENPLSTAPRKGSD